MSEFPSAPAETPSAPVEPPDSTVPAVRRSTTGLPPWLPYFLLAVAPALIVGLIVYATAGGGGGGSSAAAAVIDGLFRSGGSGDIQSFKGEEPAGFPKDMPTYPGSKVLVSFLIQSGDGASYFVIYETGDDVEKVLSFFQEKFDEDPWQVEGAINSEELNALGFSRPDDADVQGNITITESDLGPRTAIYVSFDDLTPSGSTPAADKPFALGLGHALPPGFPSDVPIYTGKEKSTVTSASFARGAGSTRYEVAFVTKNSDVDVIDFYRNEFQKRGWSVSDGQPLSARDFSLSIDFQDSARQQLQGSIRADAHPDDAAYTLVVLQVDVSATRGRGN